MDTDNGEVTLWACRICGKRTNSRVEVYDAPYDFALVLKIEACWHHIVKIVNEATEGEVIKVFHDRYSTSSSDSTLSTTGRL